MLACRQNEAFTFSAVLLKAHTRMKQNFNAPFFVWGVWTEKMSVSIVVTDWRKWQKITTSIKQGSTSQTLRHTNINKFGVN